jgi:ubiquinone/menaquinone biosynthesis C-methylase UbiE
MEKLEWHDQFFKGIFTQMLAGQYDEAANRRQAKGIKKLLGLRKGQKVLDLPCGQGRLTHAIARLGVEATGMDRQAHYIRLAKKKGRSRNTPHFLVGDMRQTHFEGTFDGIFNWFGSFGYFPESQNQKVLDNFHRALKPGGRLLIEGLNKDWILKNFKPVFELTAGGVKTIHENRWDKAHQRIDSLWTLTAGRKKEVHRVLIRLYNARDLTLMLRRAGFKKMRFFQDLKGHPLRPASMRFIVVAQKQQQNNGT